VIDITQFIATKNYVQLVQFLSDCTPYGIIFDFGKSTLYARDYGYVG